MKRSAEARSSFEAYVASEPERLAVFRSAVQARGGPPVTALDLSRASLGPLGAWFLTPPPPGPEDGERPTWAAHYPADQPSLREAWLIDGLATYFAATLQRAHRSLRWELDADRGSADRGRPVLVPFGQGQLWPPGPVSVKLYRARDAATADPDWLIAMFDAWSGYVPMRAQAAARGVEEELDAALEDVEVERLSGDQDWNVQIWVSEAAESVLGEAAFDGLEERFSVLEGVERIAWEDRERFLVRVRPETDLGQLREGVRAAIRAARTRA